jgi:hypothetical protein
VPISDIPGIPDPWDFIRFLRNCRRHPARHAAHPALCASRSLRETDTELP